jgi:hypothetical protein
VIPLLFHPDNGEPTMALAVIDVEGMEFKAGRGARSELRSLPGRQSLECEHWRLAGRTERRPTQAHQSPCPAPSSGVWLGLVDVPISDGVVAVYWHPRLGNVGFYGAEPKSPTRYVSIAFPVS